MFKFYIDIVSTLNLILYCLVVSRPLKLQKFKLPQSKSVPNKDPGLHDPDPGQTYSRPVDETCI